MNDKHESISHWGMIDTTRAQYGTLTIVCDGAGTPKSHVFENMEEAMPLLVVVYDNRGLLSVHGDHDTGIVKARVWWPAEEGMEPPLDAFTSGFSVEVADATRH